MRKFTAKGKLRHHDPVDDKLISLEDGDTVSLRDELVEFFCAHGWGTSEGVETKPAVPGAVTLKVG